jgi:hypothetical protein
MNTQGCSEALRQNPLSLYNVYIKSHHINLPHFCIFVIINFKTRSFQKPSLGATPSAPSRTAKGGRVEEMASSFGAKRSENVDALFSRVVENLVGVSVQSPFFPRHRRLL